LLTRRSRLITALRVSIVFISVRIPSLSSPPSHLL